MMYERNDKQKNVGGTYYLRKLEIFPIKFFY